MSRSILKKCRDFFIDLISCKILFVQDDSGDHVVVGQKIKRKKINDANKAKAKAKKNANSSIVNETEEQNNKIVVHERQIEVQPQGQNRNLDEIHILTLSDRIDEDFCETECAIKIWTKQGSNISNRNSDEDSCVYPDVEEVIELPNRLRVIDTRRNSLPVFAANPNNLVGPVPKPINQKWNQIVGSTLKPFERHFFSNHFQTKPQTLAQKNQIPITSLCSASARPATQTRPSEFVYANGEGFTLPKNFISNRNPVQINGNVLNGEMSPSDYVRKRRSNVF